MWHDLQTMIWKEWKELFTSRSTGRGTLLSTLIILFLLGVFMPLQAGEEWFTQPLTVVVWAWMPIFLTLGMVTDSFAGERERHTLETLLATRLPDLAILLGKILSAVLYGWGVAILSLLLAALTLNLRLIERRSLLLCARIFRRGIGVQPAQHGAIRGARSASITARGHGPPGLPALEPDPIGVLLPAVHDPVPSCRPAGAHS